MNLHLVALNERVGNDALIEISAPALARSCLIYMFQASAGGMRPALTAGPIRGLTQHDWFMRRLRVDKTLADSKRVDQLIAGRHSG